MKSEELENHIYSTYFTLRLGMAVIAILFPFILWAGGYIYAGLPLQDSMSAYYHANTDGRSMRDWFVGILFAIGAFLYLYKGYSHTENIALNCAGVFAWLIALFPMEWNCGANCKSFSIHGFSAVLFFLCIAFVCIRCASDTLNLITDDRINCFKCFYWFLGGVMIASPIIAFILTVLVQQYRALTFFIEAVGIFAFATYWLTKSYEISITNSEKHALKGDLK
jgi:hypothetical protein